MSRRLSALVRTCEGGALRYMRERPPLRGLFFCLSLNLMLTNGWLAAEGLLKNSRSLRDFVRIHYAHPRISYSRSRSTSIEVFLKL